jgi:hypothetical protein
MAAIMIFTAMSASNLRSFRGLSSLLGGVEPSPLLLRPSIGLLYQSWMIHGDGCGTIRGMKEWQWKQKYSEETCPSVAQSTGDPRTAAVGTRKLTCMSYDTT